MDVIALAMQMDYSASAQAGPGTYVAGVIGYVVGGILLWFVFAKAGEPKWAGFVPFYGSYVLTRVAGFNPWMFLLLLVPLVNVVFLIIISLRVGKAFGKSGVFSFFLLFLLSIIGYAILAFGSSSYDRSRLPA